MYTPEHTLAGKQRQIQRRVDITPYVGMFLTNLRKSEGRILKATRLDEVVVMIELLNTPKYTEFKPKVDCVASNLGYGRGYIFYFICNSCERRAKYLYEFDACDTLLCRKCCRIPYQAPTRKTRDLSRLIRKPYLSGEAKYMLIKKAGIKRRDIPDELENMAN